MLSAVTDWVPWEAESGRQVRVLTFIRGCPWTNPTEEREETGLAEGEVGCHGVSVETQTIWQGVLKVDSSLLLSQLGGKMTRPLGMDLSLDVRPSARLFSAETILKGANP